MKTIQEFYNKHGGRGGVQRQINLINSKHEIWGDLSSTEQEVLKAIGVNCGDANLMNCAGETETWANSYVRSPDFADIFRVSPEYVLPDEEPVYPTVFWFILHDGNPTLRYESVNSLDRCGLIHLFRWDTLRIEAKARCCTFLGFCLERDGEIIDIRFPWHPATGEILKYAKFTKKI